MKEEFLQLVWEQRWYDAAGMVTVSGENVEVIAPGSCNRDAGPDFFNAKVKSERPCGPGILKSTGTPPTGTATGTRKIPFTKTPSSMWCTTTTGLFSVATGNCSPRCSSPGLHAWKITTGNSSQGEPGSLPRQPSAGGPPVAENRL